MSRERNYTGLGYRALCIIGLWGVLWGALGNHDPSWLGWVEVIGGAVVLVALAYLALSRVREVEVKQDLKDQERAVQLATIMGGAFHAPNVVHCAEDEHDEHLARRQAIAKARLPAGWNI